MYSFNTISATTTTNSGKHRIRTSKNKYLYNQMALSLLFAVGLLVAVWQSDCATGKRRKIGDKENLKASCPYTACIYVSNNCGLTLYIDRTSIDDSNGVVTNVTRIESGSFAVLDISAWGSIAAGQRLYAWWQNPLSQSGLNPTQYADKVEIDYCSTNPTTMCYNPTAVDYFALPVEIGPMDNSGCSEVQPTGTISMTLSSISSNCPTNYVSYSPLGVCESPYSACMADSSLSLCSQLDSTVNECINDGVCGSGSTTTDAYGCANWFSQQAGYCAAINRGVYPSLSQDDKSQFYKNSPYNPYAAFIHENGDDEYAFPYDDYGSSGTSGYRSCATNFLGVHWCPSG